MDYCQEHPEEISKIASVQKKVHERLITQLLQWDSDPYSCVLLCSQHERSEQQQ